MIALTRPLYHYTLRNCRLTVAYSGAFMASSVQAGAPVVTVRRLPGEEHLDLSFTYKQKQVKMHRPVEEPVGKTLKRMLISVSKPDKQAKRSQRKHPRSDQPSAVDACLYATQVSETSVLAQDTLNRDAWVAGSLLVVGDQTYTVRVNTPAVLSLRMPKFALSGSALIPEVELEFTDTCQWVWRLLPESCDTLPSPEYLLQHPIVNTTMVYWPSREDAGHKVTVECTPSASNEAIGVPYTAISPVVTDTPTDTPITRRQLYTPTRLESEGQFRVVTYNTLAEPFSSSEYAQTILYPYCDPSALHIHYRQSLIVHELLGYNTDVLCLQEVATRTFQRYLQPALRDKGYEGRFAQKSGMIHEGEAIFYETSKFSLIGTDSAPLSLFLQTHPSCIELHKGLLAAPYFFAQVAKKHNIVMSVLLKSKDLPNHYLLLATTHLYYHPRGDHVRLVQVAIMMKFLQSKLEAYRQELGQEATIATMICGDFNSCPCIAAYKYVVSGSVADAHPDWTVYKLTDLPKCECDTKLRIQTGDGYDSDFETLTTSRTTGDTHQPTTSVTNEQPHSSNLPSTIDDFKGINLEHPFHFHNVCGTKQVTNFTLGYRGILDYIFADSDHLSVERTIPFPTHSELSEFVALPSVYFPSDHLSLVADLKWNY